jgi:hypothetical protein
MHKEPKKIRQAGWIVCAVALVLILPNLTRLFS